MTVKVFLPESITNQSIRDLIDRWAFAQPDRPFLIAPETGETITFEELRDSSRAFAGHLWARDLPAGCSIAYAMNNGLMAAQVILGTLYGGYLATAVNLVSGKSTIAHVLSHSDARAVFVDEKSCTLIREVQAETGNTAQQHFADSDWFTPSAASPPSCEPDSDGLLMYTSGTTGVPKGVVHTHASLLSGGANTAFAHELTTSDRGLCVLPLYHINAFCVSLMGALASGSSLALPTRFSVSTFWSQVRDHECSWFSVVPTQISYLLHDAQTHGHDSSGLSALRFGRSASAPLSPDVQQAFEKQFRVPIIETMGLTETAAQILSNPMTGERKVGSPGIAYGNEVMIADENQRECARGTEGEVLVRGGNVMRLYRNNEDATRSTITPDGWLRTGDLGRMDDDGFVFITGRLKELIIKGGENIAPREIDDALYAHPDVIEAAAFARDCDRYGQTVEAAVVVTSESILDERALIRLCEDAIGTFKAPDCVHFFAELPKGPSGKIQRLKLVELTAASTKKSA
ncbi:MAG: AMP-binding protein [Pseudomonadota bacterium]